MRAAFLITITAVFAGILIINAALQWARKAPVRKYPDGVPVWYNERMRVVYSGCYHRGRWWYTLEGVDAQVRQEDID
ncbi:MAG: hypothetical protein ACK5XN_06360 [Bacteroidota bacterium]|jgi:hypothetical protein